jgi:hypothetical protein
MNEDFVFFRETRRIKSDLMIHRIVKTTTTLTSNLGAKFMDDIPTAIPNALQLSHPLPFCVVWHAILIESDLSNSLNVVEKVLSASVQKNPQNCSEKFAYSRA